MVKSDDQISAPNNAHGHQFMKTRLPCSITMHRRYQEVCEAQQLAMARNKVLLEDLVRHKQKFSVPTGSRLELLKVQCRVYP